MPQARANIAIGLGDTAAALGWLERGYQERSFLLVMLSWPIYDGLRSQPRFQRILRDIEPHLPPIPSPGGP